ncbi:MAG: 50S ribosomal protein L21 [Spirochaetota bacterium]
MITCCSLWGNFVTGLHLTFARCEDIIQSDHGDSHVGRHPLIQSEKSIRLRAADCLKLKKSFVEYIKFGVKKMYVLVEIKGKQYKAEKGTLLKVDKMDHPKGEVVEFGNVMMVSDSGNVKVGTPFLDGIKIKAVVEDHVKDKKIIVYKYKRRKHYKRKQGHRQAYSNIRVEDILGV